MGVKKIIFFCRFNRFSLYGQILGSGSLTRGFYNFGRGLPGHYNHAIFFFKLWRRFKKREKLSVWQWTLQPLNKFFFSTCGEDSRKEQNCQCDSEPGFFCVNGIHNQFVNCELMYTIYSKKWGTIYTIFCQRMTKFNSWYFIINYQKWKS